MESQGKQFALELQTNEKFLQDDQTKLNKVTQQRKNVEDNRDRAIDNRDNAIEKKEKSKEDLAAAKRQKADLDQTYHGKVDELQEIRSVLKDK